MLGHLISYLRASLPDLRAPASTIKRECQLASDFLAIMAVRMQGRLHYRVDCPVQLHGRSCPPLMLISLVENAIKHGIEPQPDGGSVTVTISERANALILSVADTGAGLTGETSGSGVGLANIVTRLRALYGEAASFRLAANAPRGVVAIISLPLSYTV